MPPSAVDDLDIVVGSVMQTASERGHLLTADPDVLNEVLTGFLRQLLLGSVVERPYPASEWADQDDLSIFSGLRASAGCAGRRDLPAVR
jgi:hypothetical protein